MTYVTFVKIISKIPSKRKKHSVYQEVFWYYIFVSESFFLKKNGQQLAFQISQVKIKATEVITEAATRGLL